MFLSKYVKLFKLKIKKTNITFCMMVEAMYVAVDSWKNLYLAVKRILGSTDEYWFERLAGTNSSIDVVCCEV